MALEIWLPESARERADPGRRVWACLVPTSDTEICGKEFAVEQRQQFRRHVKACKKRHEDVIGRITKRRRDSVFVDGSLDPERRDWIADHADTLEDEDYFKEGLMT